MPPSLSESDALGVALRTVERALQRGATQAEATVAVTDAFSVEALGDAVETLEQSTSRSLRVRVFEHGRKATLLTSDFSEAHVDDAVRRAVDQARSVAPDEFAALPEYGNGRAPDVCSSFEDVPDRQAREKIREAIELERTIRDLDGRVTNSNGSHVGDASAIVALANSNGFSGAYRSTRAHRSTGPVATDGTVKRTGSYGTAARTLAGMEDVSDVARKAVERTVGLFGAKKPATMRVPVIFERDVAAAVLSDVFAAVSAANVAIGNSWLAQRLGTRIASGLVSIVDDGTLPGMLGSVPFDAEGVPSQRTMVCERGVLRSFLYDTYYARKLGARSTANSSGGGVAPTNFYLQAGEGSLEDLIASTPRGALVLETIGFATEHATGTYSRGAKGYLIEGGRLCEPIEEFTIASTFIDMLDAIDAVAADLRFDAGVVSPSFRVAEMTLSGD